MLQTVHSNSKLFNIARENYWKLTNYCETLQCEGYWEQPKAVLQKPILEMLDLYVQALLINLSIYCGKFDEVHKQFIIELPQTNAIGCTQEEIHEMILLTAKKIVNSPPIIIQLCGMRDVEKNSGFLGEFFDALVNIMLTVSFLDGGQNTFGVKFIQEYYDKYNAFLWDAKKNIVDSHYLLKKLSSSHIQAYPFEEERKETEKHIGITEERKETEKHSEKKEVKIQEQDVEKKEPITEGTIQFEKEVVEQKQLEQNNTICQKNEEKIRVDWSSLKAVQQMKMSIARQEMEEQNLLRIKTELSLRKKKTSLDELLEELNNLVGLHKVKDEIKSLINLIKVRNMRKSFNMPEIEMTYHMVFFGNPGTGKTTVARLIAQIYRELGLLSKGTVVETDRAGLVAGFVGQTALKVKEVIEASLGGVLFIDEAYSLTNNGGFNDFGSEVIDTLVKMMEDHRDNLVVIVAGYTQEMKEFLKANTGLVSRFNKFIEFPDYTLDELMSILDSMAKQSGVGIEEQAKGLLKNNISNMSKEQMREFGNARGIRNMFEKIMVNQANRLVVYEKPSIEQLGTVIAEDMFGLTH